MSDSESLKHTPVKHERKESQPYQPEGDPDNRPDEGPEAERSIASAGNPDRKTERVPPVKLREVPALVGAVKVPPTGRVKVPPASAAGPLARARTNGFGEFKLQFDSVPVASRGARF